MTEHEATVPEHQATRTLVKSPPELWLACSVQESLARHLRSFGEIRITRLEPETAVAWEGDATSGTVRIEPSGWGTRVTLTARSLAVTQTPEAELTAEPEPALEPALEPAALHDHEAQPEPELLEPPAEARGGFWQRLMARLRPASRAEQIAVEVPEVPEPVDVLVLPEVPEPVEVPVLPEVEPGVAEIPAEADPPATSGDDTVAALDAALESLGQAHHRPFSRG